MAKIIVRLNAETIIEGRLSFYLDEIAKVAFKFPMIEFVVIVPDACDNTKDF